MAKLSLSEVSNRFNVSRSTLYRAIKEGRLSRGSDNLFDVSEVIRCFGEPTKKNETNQILNHTKDDTDLRQLVDFMKKEIEAYKDREQRYLDQIDRFQLLLEYKDNTEDLSHDTSVKQPDGAPKDNKGDTAISHINEAIEQNIMSHETHISHPNDALRNKSITHHETSQKKPKKRGLFGRVLNAVFNED
jgi:predicted DNA-binding protein YlxM (UPF0122 family)